MIPKQVGDRHQLPFARAVLVQVHTQCCLPFALFFGGLLRHLGDGLGKGTRALGQLGGGGHVCQCKCLGRVVGTSLEDGGSSKGDCVSHGLRWGKDGLN